MADQKKSNVKGKYYVGDDCVGCGQCERIAPDNFMEGGTKDSTEYVCCYQPQGKTEEEYCAEALDCCPSDAIFDDGEE